MHVPVKPLHHGALWFFCILLFLSSPMSAASNQDLTIPLQTPLLLSAEFDYARLPRVLWRQRLLLARSAGFNALSIPVFWSFHQPQPERFLFDGQRDLGAVLDLCRREKLWAIVRIGPRLDGDWELGGLPPWLMARTVHPRTYDREFLAAVGRWFEKSVPLIAARQVQKGGAVVLVEVERADPDKPNRMDPAYSDRLREQVRSLGIAVPILFAPEEPANKPFAYSLSDGPFTGTARRAVLRLGKARPWGEEDSILDRSAEAAGLLARGVRWLDCRAFFGGTNFGFQAAEDLSARHDGGAPVGEAGDLRPTYYALKQWLCWARSAELLLVGSRSEATSNAAIADQRFPGWRFTSPAGRLLFVERRPGAAWSAAVRLDGSSPTVERIAFEPRGLWPVVHNWVLSDSLTIESSAARLLHLGIVGGRRLLAACVSPGEERTIRFSGAGGRVLHMIGEADGKPRDYPLNEKFIVPTSVGSRKDTPAEVGTMNSSESVQVVAVPEYLFARTWPFATSRGNAVLIGGDALFDVATSPAGSTQLVVASASLPAEFRLYADAASIAVSRGTATRSEPDGCWVIRTGAGEDLPPPPDLDLWQQRDDNADAQRVRDLSSWTIGSEPTTIERLPADIESPHVWYRTQLDIPAFTTYTLRVGGIGDRATIFVNGWRLGSYDGALTDEAVFLVPGGRHVLSLLVEHNGRADLSNDDGPLPDRCFKGIRPPAAVLASSGRSAIPFWQFVLNDRPPDEAREVVFSDSGLENWQVLWPGPDDMNRQHGFAWYRFGGDPRLPAISYPAPRRGMLEIWLPPVDDRAWVYLDGELVGTHDDARRGRLIRVPDTLRVRRQITSHSLAVLIENRRGPGGMNGSARVGLDQRESEIRTGPWWMRTGLTGEREGWSRPPRFAADAAAWSEITTPTRQTVVRWYRTRFVYSPVGQVVNLSRAANAVTSAPGQVATMSHAARAETFFLHLGSLRRGVVWLNGHCLGPYRQVGYDAQRGIALPACWLDRENWIVVAETGAGLPDGAFLSRDPGSDYYLTTLRVEP